MPDCACRVPSARECAERKARISAEVVGGGLFGDRGAVALDEDDYCECSCHQQDEDGMTQWDYSGNDSATNERGSKVAT